MKKLLFAIAALALFVPAMNAAELSSNPDYKAKCAMCHGANGEGKPAMKTAPMKDYAAKSTTEQLEEVISKGKPPKMPAYEGKLTPEQIKTLAADIKAAK
jgi:cytochrome c553